jgi:serine/threonine protein kinase
MMVTTSVKLVRPLGEGGMGSVWVADHLALRTQVVVKFIASGLKGNREAVERFSREAAAAAQVKSPHVVQTFDHGVTAEGVPYIVMELLEGRDLGVHLTEQGALAPTLVAEMVTQLARALDRAHERGIIHRDIKPDNVYLCDAGGNGEVFVKLLDFGIAKGVEIPKLDSGTKTGSMVGSPFYMSPEQVTGSREIDHRSDLWSVGVMTFEALTGTRPFDADTVGGLAIKIYSEPLPVPSTRNPQLPPEFDAWFEKACAREVDKRFRSAREMAEGLSRALGAAPASLDGPRIVTGNPAAVSGHAATLPSGAETGAGVVRATTQHTPRGRFYAIAVLAALMLAGVGYAALRGTHAPAAATSAAAPPPVASAPPEPAVAAASVSTTQAPVIASAPPPEPPKAPKAKARPKTKEPAAAPTQAPQPAPSGHDIF